MKKSLVLAEKPSVGKEIARVMNCRKQQEWYENERHVVTWALGHLVTLADPEAYDKKYAQWKLEDLPMLPADMKLVVIRKTRRQYETVKRLLNRPDVDEIVIATDAGREGELVARWILEKAKVDKPIKRLWISSVTDKAIRDGFGHLRDGRAYEALYASAAARAEVDWIVGLNATRALTCKFNAQLSCGRVQTPTLAMLAEREREIQSFTPRTFYGLKAKTGELTLSWRDGNSGGDRTFDESKIDTLSKRLEGKSARVVSVKRKRHEAFSPGLYNLTELQKDADRLYDFSAKETLSVMQRLYETHKLLSYPRTDSRHLTRDIVPTLKERLEACADGEYAATARRLARKPIAPSRHFVDDRKVSDHHAIIPTEEPLRLSELTRREYLIYDLVVRRFFSVLSPPHVYEEVSLETEIGVESFSAKTHRTLEKGWKRLVSESEDAPDSDSANRLPEDVQVGDRLPVDRLHKTTGETAPPPHFTEGALLAAMENPGKFLSEGRKDLARVLAETGGLGTVATRADIIEKLQRTFLAEKQGKALRITPKGRQLLDLVPEDLKTPALTARWEKKLEAIAEGELDPKAFVNDMKAYTETIVHGIKTSGKTFKHENLTHETCPECGKRLLKVKGKRGTLLVCQDRDCGYRKSLSLLTNARCPVCHKKLRLVGEGEAKTFVCACGHREKLSAFDKRKEKEKGKASYRDVQAYMDKHKKKEPEIEDSPFAALSKLKFDK